MHNAYIFVFKCNLTIVVQRILKALGAPTDSGTPLFCLPVTIVTFFLALIWIGQPIGNMAITTADIFASIFSAAFFAAFAFAMADQRSLDS